MLLSKTRLIGMFIKKMHEGMEKRKAKSRDNNKLQKPTSAHWHIKGRHQNKIAAPILPYNNNKV